MTLDFANVEVQHNGGDAGREDADARVDDAEAARFAIAIARL
jgi:hypothetical protein